MKKHTKTTVEDLAEHASNVRLRAKTRIQFTNYLFSMTERLMMRTPELVTEMMNTEGDIKPEHVHQFSLAFRERDHNGLRLSYTIRIQVEAVDE